MCVYLCACWCVLLPINLLTVVVIEQHITQLNTLAHIDALWPVNLQLHLMVRAPRSSVDFFLTCRRTPVQPAFSENNTPAQPPVSAGKDPKTPGFPKLEEFEEVISEDTAVCITCCAYISLEDLSGNFFEYPHFFKGPLCSLSPL